MHPDLSNLIALQEADREIARLNAEIQALPLRVAAIEEKLSHTRGEIENAKAALAANQKERKHQESEIQDQRTKISKYREQSLAVKTNEQYKALMHEIEYAESHIRAAEDKILEGMVQADAHEATLKAAEAELKEETAEIEKEKAEARARTAEDEALLREWTAKRDALRGQITPDVVEHYDRVLKLRKTSAITEAIAHQCGECHVLLRPQTYNEVRRNDSIVTCDSCGRILYYDPSHEPPPEPSRSRKRAVAVLEEEEAEPEGPVSEAGPSTARGA
ncbi:MAG TPA: C4-type zinc ribbon domain-containing protein [Terriglobales bacterium]|nr:C4-type zinc ribbon domain-containing protein [Terriglobales bacterium]